MKRMRDGKVEPLTTIIYGGPMGGSMQLAWAGQPAFLEILAVEAELEKKVAEALQEGWRVAPYLEEGGEEFNASLYGKGKS
jgi:hypothetical protein